jgi:hypothetical protein
MLSHQHCLFAKMRPIAGDFCIGSSAAETYLFCRPIDLASARAHYAFLQQPAAFINAPG